MDLNIYTDGGSRGNPGVSGYGFVVFDQNHQLIHQQSKFLGIKTNNEAEYMGVIDALTWVNQNLARLSPQKITFFSDSQLLVRQLQRVYKVKSPNLKPLFESVLSLINQIKVPLTFTEIRRESNQLADSLANQAMDKSI
jgi:ribonuclease HI